MNTCVDDARSEGEDGSFDVCRRNLGDQNKRRNDGVGHYHWEKCGACKENKSHVTDAERDVPPQCQRKGREPIGCHQEDEQHNHGSDLPRAHESLVEDDCDGHEDPTSDHKARVLKLGESENVQLVIVHEVVVATVGQPEEHVEDHGPLEEAHLELMLHYVVVVSGLFPEGAPSTDMDPVKTH